MRVRARLVRRIHERVETLAIHETDEQIPERLAARVELCGRFAQRRAVRHRLQRVFEAPRARRRQLAGREQALERRHLLSWRCAAREIGRPRGFERSRRAAAGGSVLRIETRDCHVDDRRPRRAQFPDDVFDDRRRLALAGDADE